MSGSSTAASSLSSTRAISPSSHSISSSVPSIAFEILHFLKDRTTISDRMFCHVSFTHLQTVVSDAALIFLAGVKVFSPLIIHCVHFSLKWSLKGLFRQTSSGCTRLVKPPGMTAWVEQFPFRSCFAESPRWALKESQTRRLLELLTPPGLVRHTFSIHNFTPSSSIQPLGWTWTKTPGQNLSLGIVFRQKITIGFSLVPSARQESTTVNLVFSFPVVLRSTVLTPRDSTVLAAGISNHTGVSSMFPICTSS